MLKESQSLMEMKQFHWFHPREEAVVKVLLLENISEVAVRIFSEAGFEVRHECRGQPTTF